MSETISLFGRVTKVMQTVKALEPDKKHQQGYMYISSDKVLGAISAAMAQNGLVIVPSVTSQQVEIVEYTSNNNKAMTRFDASVTFAMVLADADGHEHSAVWVGAGSDFTSPDKAIYKAITSGHKYFMLKLFVVGAGAEDSEHEDAQPGHVIKHQMVKQQNGKQPPSPEDVPTWDETARYGVNDEVMVRGKDDEKPGTVLQDEGGDTLLVKVGKGDYWIKRDRVSIIKKALPLTE